MVQSHVPDAVKNSRTVTVQNILFTFIQNTVMYKNVHNIFHSVYILKKDNCNFKYFLLTCHINIVLGPFSLLKLYPLLEIFMTGEMLLDGELDLLNQFLKPHTWQRRAGLQAKWDSLETQLQLHSNKVVDVEFILQASVQICKRSQPIYIHLLWVSWWKNADAHRSTVFNRESGQNHM